MSRELRNTLLLTLAIFLLNVALNAALFLPGESKYRDSIEAGYASMALFISQYPDPFGWNPFQYFGLPTHVWYLPGIPYFAALWIRLLPWLAPEHVYRIVTTALACMGPATVFLFARYFTRNNTWALVAALLYTFCSPSYLIYPQIDRDRGLTYLPWHVQVLTKYGEGPHNAGLTLLPLALIACWKCATGRGYARILLAAVLLAAVTLTNWVAAMALAWCCLMMLVTGLGTAHQTGFLARRLLAAAGLAYLLACFWLTPRFVQTTLFNWPVDAFGYRLRLQEGLLLAGLPVLVVVLRWLFLRVPGRHYLCLLALCFAGFAYVTSFHYRFSLDTIPESRRYAIEMEMFLFLFLAEATRLAVAEGRLRWRDAGGAAITWVALLGLYQAGAYATRAWVTLQPMPREQTIEYRVAEFVASQSPSGRVFVSGGTRFRLNSWFLIPQVGGTFESGLRNRTPVYLTHQLRTGMGRPDHLRAHDAVNLLKVAGAEYVVMHGLRSQEHWKDVRTPEMFEGVLERVYHDHDDSVYRLPFQGLAHLVEERELPPRRPIGYDTALAESYVAAIEAPDRPKLKLTWEGASRLEVRGRVPEGFLVSLQVSYDGGWRAWQDGQPLALEGDSLDYILIRPRPALDTRILLEYRGTKEQWAFTGLSAAAWMAAIGGLLLGRRRRTWNN